MAPTYATLALAYFEENLYEIIGKNTIIQTQNLRGHGKKMIVSYSGNSHGTT